MDIMQLEERLLALHAAVDGCESVFDLCGVFAEYAAEADNHLPMPPHDAAEFSAMALVHAVLLSMGTFMEATADSGCAEAGKEEAAACLEEMTSAIVMGRLRARGKAEIH